MALINISICLTDIPKEAIKVSERNGKKYLSIVVAERKEPDQYDNTHTVYVSQTKEEREAKAEKRYIGSGKLIAFNHVTPANVDDLPPAQNFDDLPF
ncbi:MAG: hypothetical protein LBV41_08535 [Cytophagaceae bacterium]|jgi:spore germination cell wall hydrolase CwlJ-like protein|nr:hypothetical protein [Cytophagaceae bacterium]